MDIDDSEPREAIAIIGMACRFPGGAHSPEQLFENLEAGRSAWCEFPSDRLNIDGFYHPSSERHDSFNFKGAHFLTGNIAAFDAEFFSMSAAESNSTDVQQRILLEVAYEAVENAGIPKEKLAGENASVYIGSFVKDYEQVSMRDAQHLAADCATGNGIAIMSNRISYFFDIHGPSMTIDTGCSASLICIHQAVQSLLSGESSLAMAGGAGMILTPSTIMPMVSLGFLSKDGKCYTFDSRANGYGRGEGVGIVVLKRLSDAIRDNDTIRGVIRGTSTNQDGRTSGITMPSSEAQVLNIRKCYASAGLDVDKTMFVESHGTGTQAGDPRELKAIAEALCNGRDADKPLLVGSLKTNIGHLEGSAGVAGIIKAVMIIEQGRIPKHINFQSWNPDIDNQRLKVNVPLETTPWPTKGLRRISVNSFGFGGSNAHAIIDDAPNYAEEVLRSSLNHNATLTSSSVDWDVDMVDAKDLLPSRSYLFVFSANDQAGLARLADAHLSRVTRNHLDEYSMRDYAYTLFDRRSKLQYKSFVVARNDLELASELGKLKTSQPLRSSKPRTLNFGFVFCGQGAQWYKMALDLYCFRPFKESLQSSSDAIKKQDSTYDLFKMMEEDPGSMTVVQTDHPLVAQPATTAVQIALVDLLKACLVTPTAVVGHSSGEIAAAYAANLITREEAIMIAYYRGKAASRVSLKGSMLAVSLGSTDAQKYVDASNGAVCIACVNSPESVTLSGDTEQIMDIQGRLKGDGILNKLLPVETAYHSHHMRKVSEEYKDMLQVFLPKEIKEKVGPAMFSSVTGQQVKFTGIGPTYWTDNMVGQVRFDNAVSSMLQAKKDVRPDIFIEISPHTVLTKALKEIVAANSAPDSKGDIQYFPTMIREKDNSLTVLKTLGELWARGLHVKLDWLHQHGEEDKPKCLVDLPTYPWDHSKSYWHESHLSKAHRFRKFGSHDLLGAMTADSIVPQEPQWRGFIDIAENPWIEHHKVQRKTMYPAAGMVAMVVEAAKQVVDGAVDSPSDILDFLISEFHIHEPMIIAESQTRLEYNFKARRSRLVTTDDVTSWVYTFDIYSILDTSSAPPYLHTANAGGTFMVRFKPRGLGERGEASVEPWLEVPMPSMVVDVWKDTVQPLEFYERLNIIGLNYGKLFRNITSILPPAQCPNDESKKACWTKVRIPNTKAIMPEQYETPSTIHPATLDSMFQSLFVFGDEPMVPRYIRNIYISASIPQGAGTEFVGCSVAKRKGDREAVADIVMWHKDNPKRPVVSIRGLTVVSLATPAKGIPDFLPDHRNLCSQVVWKEDAHSNKDSDDRTFREMLELMGHRFPGMRVLQIGGEAAVAYLVVKVLCRETTPRIGSYLFLDEWDDAHRIMEDVTAKDLRPLLDYEELTDKDNLAEDLGNEKFDLVLADARMGIYRSNLLQVLKPTGVLAYTHKDAATNGVAAQDGVVSGHFKPSTELDEESDWIPRSWYSLPQAYPAKLSGKTVIILYGGLSKHKDPHRISRSVPVAHALEARLKAAGLQVIMWQTLTHFLRDLASVMIISLLEIDNDVDTVWDIDPEHYLTMQRLFQNMNDGILWVTAGAQMDSDAPTKSPFLGWARTVRSEEPDKQIVCLDLEVGEPYEKDTTHQANYKYPGVEEAASTIAEVFFRSFATTVPVESREVEIAARGGRLYISRLEPLEEMNKLIDEGMGKPEIVYEQHTDESKALKLVRGNSGAVDDVYFQEDPDTERPLKLHEVLIDVKECYLIPDVFPSPDDGQRGYRADCWGIVVKVGGLVSKFSRGEHVVTINRPEVTTRVIADHRFVWHDDLTDSDFAHAPSCLVTASCCLRGFGDGLKVLVHGPFSPHGQAAIQVGWNLGGTVYAVVRDESEKGILVRAGILEDRYILIGGPGLPQAVKEVTSSKGMDFVFNPTPDHREKDFGLVQSYGTVVHLTHPGAPRTLSSTGCFQLVTFDLTELMEQCPSLVAEHFDAVQEMSRHSIQRPVLEEGYPFGEARLAMKQMNASPFQGVFLLCRIEYQDDGKGGNRPISDEEPLPFARVPTGRYPEARLSWYSTYIVTGGLGGLGLTVVKWLADHGARHIVVFTRSFHGNKPAARACFEKLQKKYPGIRLGIRYLDICDRKEVMKVFKELDHPVAGIIQAAAVIKDGIYQNLKHKDWKLSADPKTLGSYNLHLACLTLDDPPDFFILLSSAAGIIGNPGQSSYNAGNAFCDALARHRCSQGLHSVSIDLGPVLGAGMVAADEALWDQLRAGGFIGVRLEDFHAVLERAVAVTKPAGLESSDLSPFRCPPQVVMGVGTGGLVKQNRTANPFWTRTRLFSYLNLVDLPAGSSVSSDSSSGRSSSLKPALEATSSRADAASLLLPHFVRALGEVMGKSHTEIDPDSILDDHGPDSLRMKEVTDWIYQATGVKVTAINQMPLRSICAHVVDLGGFGGGD